MLCLLGGQRAVTDGVPCLQNSDKSTTCVLKHFLAWMQFVVVCVRVYVRERLAGVESVCVRVVVSVFVCL